MKRSFLVWCIAIFFFLPALAYGGSHVSYSKRLGKSFVQEALRHYSMVKDPDVVNMVNRVGRRILKAIGANPDTYHFFIVREDEPNAFAIPGGYIFIFDGLLKELTKEDELAGVLAHEIAHVERNHFFKDEKKLSALDIATIAAILLSGGSMATTAIAGATNISIRLQFSRENEAEADSYALRYLIKAGYPPSGLLDFFNTLLRYERFNPQTVPAYMSTHPALRKRRLNVINFTRRNPFRQKNRDIRQVLAWKRVLAILMAEDLHIGEEGIILQKLNLEDISLPVRTEIEDYLLGVMYMKKGYFDKAIQKYISALMYHKNYLYYADLAYCYLKKQNLRKAFEAAEESIKLNRNYALPYIIMGIISHKKGELSRALSYLGKALRVNPYDILANYHIAMVYGEEGNKLMKAYYLGQYFRNSLDPFSALKELRRAKDLARKGSPLFYRIEKEIEEIEREGV